MTAGRLPSERQRAFAQLPLTEVLLIAPAGCGKTEALAQRAAACVERGDVPAPRKVLALTFSNKAKDNLIGRVRAQLGKNWRRSITITNFHGLATRLIQSHGTAVGIDPNVTLPDRVWRRRILRELGAEFDDEMEALLRQAKGDDADDETVLARIESTGHERAIEYELRLRENGRIDYDDQIRHAARLLAIPDVARLYRAHFAMVLVDEVQDLTMRQLGLVKAIGGNSVTYAGDPSQGIYSFAGAEPDQVFSDIRAQNPTVIELNESYRSSPAVLAAVNSLGEGLGSVPLHSAFPDRWPDGGRVLMLRRPTTDDEAAVIAEFGAGLLDGQRSIGVIARRRTRMDGIRKAMRSRGIEHTDWGDPTHLAHVVQLLQRHVRRATGEDDWARLQALRGLCHEAIDPADAETHDEIEAVVEELENLVGEGSSLKEAVDRCRPAGDPDDPVPPGIHLLTGHVGKGQEFDWVIVVGLEDGHIPDFRNKEGAALFEELRVLHVMVSRARDGLVLTFSERTPTRFGWRAAQPSPWLAKLEAVATGAL